LIYSRDLTAEERRPDEAFCVAHYRDTRQPLPTKPKETVSIQRRVNTPSGSINATITLEAVSDVSGDIVRSESFRVSVLGSPSQVTSRVVQFREELEADGYNVRGRFDQ